MPKQGEADDKPLHELADCELMARLARGQRDALDVLMQRHQPAALTLAYRFLGRWSDAEDVAQDAFVRVFRAADRYQPTAKFSTWLYRIVTNLCWDRRRRAAHAPAGSAFLGDPPQAGAAEADEQSQVCERVRVAVGELPDRQRLALILHRYQGLSHEQIAGATGWSVSAVESCLVRAYAALRQRLADLAGGGES